MVELSALSVGTVATIVVGLQLVTVAATPLTVTVLPGRKPMPLMVTVPPVAGTVAGAMVSAYRTRPW